MKLLEDMIDRAKKAKENLSAMIGEVLEQHEGDIMDLQQIQLLEGHDSDEKNIRPLYTEDLKPNGYFKNRTTASNYAAWKETLSYPYTVSRHTNAPNLYINGRFHDELRVNYKTDGLSIVPSTSYAAGIVAKYGSNTFGLSMEKWGILFQERGVKEQIVKTFKKQLING